MKTNSFKNPGIFFITLTFILTACSMMREPEYKIISTSNDKTLEDILCEADKNTLVVFDCDEVLITTTDVAFSPRNVKNTYERLVKYLNERMSNEAADEIILKVRMACSFQLVNENWLQIIRQLHLNDVKMLVLTAHWTGEYHGNPHVEDIRKNDMKSLGFDFRKSWSKIEKIVFEEFPVVSPFRGGIRYPIFDEGIIFSCNLEKGKMLKAFLNHVPYKFSKIIFVDDKCKNVESVVGICKGIGISCIGVEYTKVATTDSKEISLEELKPRMDNLIKTGKW